MHAWKGTWRTYAAVWIPLLTFIVLAIHPLPLCVDCEFPKPWGHDDAAYVWDLPFLGAWLAVSSFVAGVLAMKWRWLVPTGIVAANLATQPIGGVPLWSLSANEGPLIVLLGLPAGFASLILGDLARLAFKHFGRSGSG